MSCKIENYEFENEAKFWGYDGNLQIYEICTGHHLARKCVSLNVNF